MPCAGNASALCGGPSRLSVYNYTLYQPPIHKPVIAGYGFRGCYTDSAPRTLDTYSTTSNAMTQEFCVDVCAARGYEFAGVEYGSQCFCGNGISVSADGRSGVKVKEDECGMICGGDRTELCGAGNRVGIWGKV